MAGLRNHRVDRVVRDGSDGPHDWVLDNRRRFTGLLSVDIPRCARLSRVDYLRDGHDFSAEYPVDQVC
jgi:hypothetical protein